MPDSFSPSIQAASAIDAASAPEIPVPACVISAMPEEMAPFHAKLLAAGYTAQAIASPAATISLFSRDAEPADPGEPHPNHVLTAVTGIGFAATASSLGWLLAHFAPAALISIGSAGGLGHDAAVREVVLGLSYRNGGADGTAFGYVRGQVPGQPEYFSADPALLAAATVAALDALELNDVAVRPGDMISSDTFVTEATVGDMREAFPSAVTADMESYAAAHVAHQWGIPFLSMRAISDLCAPPEEEATQFHAELAEVAELSARTAWATLRQL